MLICGPLLRHLRQKPKPRKHVLFDEQLRARRTIKVSKVDLIRIGDNSIRVFRMCESFLSEKHLQTI
jgi:hypothetical protein